MQASVDPPLYLLYLRRAASGTNAMPPFSVGVAQVEERLRILRRRLNLFALQDAVYLSASVCVLAAGLVVALAMRGRPSVFTVALWAAAAAPP